MAEMIHLTCPECGNALEIPAALEEFSCMYCGKRARTAAVKAMNESAGSDYEALRAELREALDRAGFDVCGLFGDTDFHAPTPEAERWHLVARTRKTGDWYLNADRA